jgi:hypothetical protein
MASMCRWLTAHLCRFLEQAQEANGGLKSGKFGPLNELSMAVFALAATDRWDSCPELAGWVEKTAARLTSEAEGMGPRLHWDRYAEAVRTDPLQCLAWLFIPAAEIATGRLTQLHAGLVQDFEEPLSNEQADAMVADPCFCFFLELLGVRDCSAELRAHLSRTVEQTAGRATTLSGPEIYDITHALFFLTQFGRLPHRRVELPESLLNALPEAALSRLVEGDFDLAAEIVVSLLYAGCSLCHGSIQVANIIASRLPADGGVISTRGINRETRQDFLSIYHSTLVCLMALAEVHRRLSIAA